MKGKAYRYAANLAADETLYDLNEGFLSAEDAIRDEVEHRLDIIALISAGARRPKVTVVFDNEGFIIKSKAHEVRISFDDGGDDSTFHSACREIVEAEPVQPGLFTAEPK